MNVSRLFILVFGLVGLGMGIADFYIVRNLLAFRAEAVQVEGTVVGFVTSRGSKGGTMYSPRVRRRLPGFRDPPRAHVRLAGAQRHDRPGAH